MTKRQGAEASGVVRIRSDRRRILFVDDDPTVRSTFVRAVRRHGFEVDVTESVDEAIERAQRTHYPVIVTDLKMPGADGISLIEALSPHQPLTTFIVVTAAAKPELRSNVDIDRSIVAIVPKPWEDDELASVIDRAMELHDRRHRRSLPPAAETLRILLLEDNAADRELVTHHLREGRVDAEIVQTQRLAAALERLHEESFDVVLADLSLPDARGLDCVVRIRAAAPSTPVIVLSGTDDEEVAIQAIQHGAQDFLAKDAVDPKRLGTALRFARERKNAELRLAHLAYYDQLTGLANRATLEVRLRGALERFRRSGVGFAVLYLDIDHFKAINDRLGHDAGDDLLRLVSERLRATTRERDVVARLGGDEFAVIVEDADEDDAREIGERILAAMHEPAAIAGETMTLTISVGVATLPGCAQTLGELLKRADEAMYRAKQAGRDALRLATPSGSPPPARLDDD